MLLAHTAFGFPREGGFVATQVASFHFVVLPRIIYRKKSELGRVARECKCSGVWQQGASGPRSYDDASFDVRLDMTCHHPFILYVQYRYATCHHEHHAPRRWARPAARTNSLSSTRDREAKPTRLGLHLRLPHGAWGASASCSAYLTALGLASSMRLRLPQRTHSVSA